MMRFLIIAMIWLYASFGLLWWVQVAIDQMHYDAAEIIGGVMATQSFPSELQSQEITGLPEGLSSGPMQRVNVQDLEILKGDRKELLRRLRVLWITLTIMPILAGLFTLGKREAASGQKGDIPPESHVKT